MSYMWNEFNIKTFPAETIVYRDGVYCQELSTLDNMEIISRRFDLPVHIIYVGKLRGENTLNINLSSHNQPVFLTINSENNFPAFLNIFIKNTGKNSEIRGHIMLKNSSDLDVKILAEHDADDTGILLQTKIIGTKASFSKIYASAKIGQNVKNTKSDIRIGALATDKSAKFRLTPVQGIKSIPEYAEHGAYIFQPKPTVELYLRESGLSGAEVHEIMQESFKNDFNLF